VRRADHSSRGAQPNVACLSVIAEPREGGLVLLRLPSYKNIAAQIYIYNQGFFSAVISSHNLPLVSYSTIFFT
jgi:hypothetical protein